MALSIQDSRILLKRSTNTSEVPTAAPSSDFTDGTWTSLDVYVGEAFTNVADEKLWLRFTNNIRQIAVADSPTVNRLTYWNASGHLGNISAPTDGYYLKYTNASGYHWATAGGSAEDLATTLAAGNTSGAYSILMNTTQTIGFKDGDNTYTTYISNNQSQAANRTVYTPLFDGRMVIHAQGTSLTSGRVPYVTTNGLISDTSNFVWDNSNVRLGIGTTPSYLLHIQKDVNDFPYHVVIGNNNTGNQAASSLRINTDVNGMEFGVLCSGNTVYSTYGGANDAFLRYNPSVSYKGNVNFLLSPNASTTKAFRFFVSQNAGSNYRLAIDKDGVLIKGSTSDSTAYALKVDNSSSSKLVYARNDGTIELYDGGSISLGTTTGVKIGIGTTDKLGFWNTTPIVQPTTGITAATFAANTSAIADDTATFDGYTIGQVVKALRNVGLLA